MEDAGASDCWGRVGGGVRGVGDYAGNPPSGMVVRDWEEGGAAVRRSLLLSAACGTNGIGVGGTKDVGAKGRANPGGQGFRNSTRTTGGATTSDGSGVSERLIGDEGDGGVRRLDMGTANQRRLLQQRFEGFGWLADMMIRRGLKAFRATFGVDAESGDHTAAGTDVVVVVTGTVRGVTMGEGVGT